MGNDEGALLRLRREKRGEAEPEDLSGNLVVQLGVLTEELRQAFPDHERSKSELKALMLEDAKEAIGHGVRAKRSKSGAISFDLLAVEDNRAAIQ
jgi:hypothetical protein